MKKHITSYLPFDQLIEYFSSQYRWIHIFCYQLKVIAKGKAKCIAIFGVTS